MQEFECPKCKETIMVSSDDICQNASVYCKHGHYFPALKLTKPNHITFSAVTTAHITSARVTI